MKLGYEFYAPRILDEMQKNPEKSFEDTQYWRAFQTHLKSYTDKVMQQTMDSLANFPKEVLDTLIEKFGEYLGDALQGTTPVSYSGSPTQVRLDLGQGFRREDPKTRQEGPSLFEKDQQRARERSEEARKKALIPTPELKVAIRKNLEKFSPTPNSPSTGNFWELWSIGKTNSGSPSTWQRRHGHLSKGSTRRRSQSSDLALKNTKLFLIYLSKQIELQLNRVPPNQVKTKQVWELRNHVMQGILDWPMVYK